MIIAYKAPGEDWKEITPHCAAGVDMDVPGGETYWFEVKIKPEEIGTYTAHAVLRTEKGGDVLSQDTATFEVRSTVGEILIVNIVQLGLIGTGLTLLAIALRRAI